VCSEVETRAGISAVAAARARVRISPGHEVSPGLE